MSVGDHVCATAGMTLARPEPDVQQRDSRSALSGGCAARDRAYERWREEER
jgi:hypothetical protein